MAFVTLQDLSLFTVYAGFKHVESWWNFKNVISPFYRLYYIEKGKGRVYIDNIPYDLVPGQLFLIPKFAFHSYECSDFMDRYYICFFDDLTKRTGIPHPSEMNLQVAFHPYDLDLVKRYLLLNPHKELVTVDPKHYNKTIYKQENRTSRLGQAVESNGILLQLFSRFFTDECVNKYAGDHTYDKLDDVVNYINQNLDKHISIIELAEMICLTPDHFSRTFNSVMGMTPCKYIQMKRIKRAQALLVTSDMSIAQVAENVGIYSPSQFTRLFTKIALCNPKEYRIQQLKMND